MTTIPKSARWVIAGFSLVLLVLWRFPDFWYSPPADDSTYAWLHEQGSVPNWEFREVPVAKAAEAVLVADRMVSGDFTNSAGMFVRVFSAKRYLKKENEIGLFSHTPDRCWTAAGWNIEPTDPDHTSVTVHDLPILFERRVFTAGSQRELVYFGALVGGRPLPYRIDQYLTAAMRKSPARAGDQENTWTRIAQGRVWGWAMESFTKRLPLSGPQHFIRISTPVVGSDIEGAERRLKEMLPHWLKRISYPVELAEWKARKS